MAKRFVKSKLYNTWANKTAEEKALFQDSIIFVDDRKVIIEGNADGTGFNEFYGQVPVAGSGITVSELAKDLSAFLGQIEIAHAAPGTGSDTATTLGNQMNVGPGMAFDVLTGLKTDSFGHITGAIKSKVKIGVSDPKNGELTLGIAGNSSVSASFSADLGDDTTFTIPVASSTGTGVIGVGFTRLGKMYPVQLDNSNNAYVLVPWENDTNTEYSFTGGTNQFTVVPTGDGDPTPLTVTITPSISLSGKQGTSTTAAPFITEVTASGTTSHTVNSKAFTGTVGSSTQGIYFDAGVPKAMTYTLGKSVPANAVFTDTKCTSLSLTKGTATTPSGDTVEVLSNASISASGTGTSLSGTLTAVSVPTKDYVDKLIAAGDALVFKGTIGTGGTVTALPTSGNVGWTYKVITAGTYAGQACSVGDMIIAVVDFTSASNSNWSVIQSNVELVGAKDTIGLIKNGSTVTSASGYTACPIIGGVPYYKPESKSGTVTSVGMTVPTGLTVSPSSITSSGTFAVSFATGYSIPTKAKLDEWSEAFDWGDHAAAGYVKSSGVTSVTPGTGLTGTSSDDAITSTGTINLKTAAAGEIGGIKVASVGTAASGANTTINANKFAVHIDSNGLGYVAIPAYSNNSGDITEVAAGTGLTGGATSGKATLSLATSGVTAGSYGDDEAARTLTHGDDFDVPQITVDAYGRITAASSKKLVLPASGDTDKKTASSNSTSKVFLVGAASQSTSGQTTYSNTSVYMQNGVLYSEGYEVVNMNDWAWEVLS